MRRSSAPRAVALALALTLTAGCTGGPGPGRSGDGPPRPASMAALGDSITRAHAACGRSADCAELSWATGSAEGLGSHRRERVRARVQAYNAAMAAACDRHGGTCRHDRGAVFDHRFDLADVSPVDYWHPSSRGQATLARVAWEAGPWA